jgi:cation:H+ antiporter
MEESRLSMLFDLAILITGMALLLLCGRLLVSGASQLSRALGVSELTVALTVVAFGTSAPELAVNGLAAIQGSSAIAFGNIIGSNITNIALVIGVCGLVRPLAVGDSVLRREIPLMLLATALAVALGLDLREDGLAGSAYARNDGVVLLVLFAVLMMRTITSALSHEAGEPLDRVADTLGLGSESKSMRAASLQVVIGLGGVIGAAQLTVTGAVGVARALDVPEDVIALTVIALGTSLPELATSLVAASRGQTDLAVGNVVGSNVFNLLFILGATAVIRPVDVPAIGGVQDLMVMSGVSLALLAFARLSGGRVTRWQGVLLLAVYLTYVGVRYTV